MKFQLKKRPQSVLGLSLHDGRLRAALVVRSKAGGEVAKSAAGPLALDLLHPEPELIGREIRNQLEAAGIRERSCAVALPEKWVMSLHTKLPDLAPADVDSFLLIEAEKGFPCDLAQLQIARSTQRADGATYVTQLAVRRDQLDQLSAVLKAAGLKPVSFSLGLASVPGVIPPEGGGRITLALEPQGATLLIAAGGGIAAFRTFEAAIESEAGEKVVNGGSVARELRITVEQVPADLRGQLRRLSLCGDEALARQLADSLREWGRAAGMAIDEAAVPDGSSAKGEDPLQEMIAKGVATQWLEPAGPRIEFLPPRPGRWEMMMARYHSKRLATAGMAVGALVALLILAFGWQVFRLVSLRSDWRDMQAQVTELKGVQDRIHNYQPWYDRTFSNLRILARVTECFPQNGSLTAKTFDVRRMAGGTVVSISGTARDGQALLRTQDQLHKVKEIQGLKVDGISGKMPAQFTLTFHWMGNPGS